MEEFITFYDEETGEEIYFEVMDSIDLEGHRYILVADNENNASILKEIEMDEEEITYEFVEEDNEFQKVALLFYENESEYEIEF